MYSEDELVPLSALQHYVYCPRQCALIHLEQTWVDNRFTAEGSLLHERVDVAGGESRRDSRRVFGLSLQSRTLGLSGRADVVEFHKNSSGRWQPFPIEHKRGRPKKGEEDRIQLCAQAICLEEMLDIQVLEGALYYGKKRRRLIVELDESLRGRTAETALAVHQLFESARTPHLIRSKKCDKCSFLEICMPDQMGKQQSVSRYLAKLVTQS